MKLTLLGIFVLPGFLAQATLGGPIVLSTGTAAYTISSDTTGEGLIPTTVSPLASGWLANPISNGVTGANGVWIAPNPSQSTEPNTVSGDVVYNTVFSLLGLNASTAVLTMNLTADDYVDVSLNGHSI